MANLRRRMMMSQEDNEKLDYLTIIPDEPTSISVYPASIHTDKGDYAAVRYYDFQYSLDDGKTWYTATFGSYDEDEDAFETFYVTNTLKLKANLVVDSVRDNQTLFGVRIDAVKSYTVGGSVMSLCYGDDFSSYTGELTWPLYNMFYYSTKLRRINTPKTFLSATSYKYADNNAIYGAYEYMFGRCYYLENSPEIHLVHIGTSCCAHMFYDCSRLIEASAIHSQSVGYGGCNRMFSSCDLLVKAPDRLPATLSSGSCFSAMFSGCSSLEKAPELPALTLVSECYNYMFQNCTKLNYCKAKFTTTPGTAYTYNWLSGTAATGTFVKNKDATWNVTGTNGIPSGWTVISE